jgi:hypothetical protein
MPLALVRQAAALLVTSVGLFCAPTVPVDDNLAALTSYHENLRLLNRKTAKLVLGRTEYATLTSLASLVYNVGKLLLPILGVSYSCAKYPLANSRP